MASSAKAPWLLGKDLGGYTLVEFVGSGAFSDVFRGVSSTGSVVALKVLDINAGGQEIFEFENEGDLLTSLRSASGVVDLLTSSIDPVAVPLGGGSSLTIDIRYHVLELAQDSLDSLLAVRQNLSWPDRLKILREVCLGVHQMRLAGICHRDLKAANCLLFARPFNSVQAKINDLGRSRKLLTSGSTVDYSFGRGDPTFAPPEMLWLLGEDTKDCHVAADLYGLGGLMYEIATGQAITGVALGPSIRWMNANARITPIQRRDAYFANLAMIRRRYEVALSLLDAELPREISRPYKDLIRRLTEPDPRRRLAARIGRKTDPAGHVWLLNRLDIFMRMLRASKKQRMGRRPTSVR